MAVKRFSNSLISQSGQDKVTNFIAGYSPAIDEMDLIERVVVGSGGTSTITFSNIPQRYQHLQIRAFSRDNQAGTTFNTTTIRFNSDSASNYARHALFGTGSASASAAESSTTLQWQIYSAGPIASANVFSGNIVDILDYSLTNKNKVTRSITGVDNNGSGFIQLSSGLWLSTNAITSITILTISTFQQFSTFSLYGVIS